MKEYTKILHYYVNTKKVFMNQEDNILFFKTDSKEEKISNLLFFWIVIALLAIDYYFNNKKQYLLFHYSYFDLSWFGRLCQRHSCDLNGFSQTGGSYLARILLSRCISSISSSSEVSGFASGPILMTEHRIGFKISIFDALKPFCFCLLAGPS